MAIGKLRQQIAFEAARLMYERQESEYFRAKLKAARRLCRGDYKPHDLPSNREIREQILSFARQFEGERRTDNLRDMRLAALRMMHLLADFRPRLIGSTLTGHVRDGSDIDLHVFCDSIDPITSRLDGTGLQYDVERKQVRKHGTEQVFRHVHVYDRFRFELTVYDTSQVNFVFQSSITGRAIERASLPELEQMLAEEYPDAQLDPESLEIEQQMDRFLIYQALLAPLESVKQSPKYHPEGDALYHSLQVFELAKEELPYDEEFLLAALLHDIGKAIDPRDHVAAALEALGDFITPRTAWLIEHHMEAHAICDGTIGQRSRRRLESHEDFDELMRLRDCDARGRIKGFAVGEVEDALDYLRDLAKMCDAR